MATPAVESSRWHRCGRWWREGLECPYSSLAVHDEIQEDREKDLDDEPDKDPKGIPADKIEEKKELDFDKELEEAIFRIPDPVPRTFTGPFPDDAPWPNPPWPFPDPPPAIAPGPGRETAPTRGTGGGKPLEGNDGRGGRGSTTVPGPVGAALGAASRRVVGRPSDVASSPGASHAARTETRSGNLPSALQAAQAVGAAATAAPQVSKAQQAATYASNVAKASRGTQRAPGALSARPGRRSPATELPGISPTAILQHAQAKTERALARTVAAARDNRKAVGGALLAGAAAQVAYSNRAGRFRKPTTPSRPAGGGLHFNFWAKFGGQLR